MATLLKTYIDPNGNITRAANNPGGLREASPWEDYQAAYQEAQNANLSRYNDILNQYNQRYNDAMGALAGYGSQQIADTNARWNDTATKGQQNLINSGLTGSTIASTMNAGYEKQKSADLNRLNENLTNTKLGYQTQLSGDTLNFMTGREDAYPDANLYMQLQQQYDKKKNTGTQIRSAYSYQ